MSFTAERLPRPSLARHVDRSWADELWLEQGRRFAVHALSQVERWREQRGHGRHTLWTGDVGAAIFAADFLDARAEVPVFDYL